MFGSLGVPELLLIFIVILLVFGPRRLPEIGRTLGKALGEFRKATDDLKSTIEREVRLEELKKTSLPTLDSFITPTEAVSRTEPYAAELPADTVTVEDGSSGSSVTRGSSEAVPSFPEEPRNSEEPPSPAAAAKLTE
jgi:TatA/E family protein of Tat protein translocase